MWISMERKFMPVPATHTFSPIFQTIFSAPTSNNRKLFDSRSSNEFLYANIQYAPANRRRMAHFYACSLYCSETKLKKAHRKFLRTVISSGCILFTKHVFTVHSHNCWLLRFSTTPPLILQIFLFVDIVSLVVNACKSGARRNIKESSASTKKRQRIREKGKRKPKLKR